MSPLNNLPDVSQAVDIQAHIRLLRAWLPLAFLGGLIGGTIAYVHTKHRKVLTPLGRVSFYCSKIFMGTFAAYMALVLLFGDTNVKGEHIVSILCGIGGWEVIGILYAFVIERLKRWLADKEDSPLD